MELIEWLKTWAWKHKCIEKTYGVDHGEIWLHKDVKKCNECDTENRVESN